MVKSSDLGTDSYLLAVWPGTIYVTFLCLAFLLCKGRVMNIISISKGS